MIISRGGEIVDIDDIDLVIEFVKLINKLEITSIDITNALGGLPENKIHCSVLGEEVLKSAIENYREKEF